MSECGEYDNEGFALCVLHLLDRQSWGCVPSKKDQGRFVHFTLIINLSVLSPLCRKELYIYIYNNSWSTNMDPRNLEKQSEPEEPRYLDFPHIEHGATRDGQPILNRYSSTLTKGHDFPGAKAMLYAAGVPDEKTLQTAPHVGIASVWWEGNPCNNHLLDLGKVVKDALTKQGMLAWQYSTPGVSDGITMGGEGMRFSLQSRELIADNIETVTCAQFHDACVTIPGCDKNMPACVMAMARHNRPSLMIYGGSIMPGYSKLLQKPINITTCFEAHGAYNFDTLTNPLDSSHTKDEILTDIEKNACPGAGACGVSFIDEESLDTLLIHLIGNVYSEQFGDRH